MTETEHDREYEVLASPMPACVVRAVRDDPNYVKCPRCWKYHTVKQNHDGLCDGCCKVLVECFPDHPSIPDITANLSAQRDKFSNNPR